MFLLLVPANASVLILMEEFAPPEASAQVEVALNRPKRRGGDHPHKVGNDRMLGPPMPIRAWKKRGHDVESIWHGWASTTAERLKLDEADTVSVDVQEFWVDGGWAQFVDAEIQVEIRQKGTHYVFAVGDRVKMPFFTFAGQLDEHIAELWVSLDAQIDQELRNARR